MIHPVYFNQNYFVYFTIRFTDLVNKGSVNIKWSELISFSFRGLGCSRISTIYLRYWSRARTYRVWPWGFIPPGAKHGLQILYFRSGGHISLICSRTGAMETPQHRIGPKKNGNLLKMNFFEAFPV